MPPPPPRRDNSAARCRASGSSTNLARIGSSSVSLSTKQDPSAGAAAPSSPPRTERRTGDAIASPSRGSSDDEGPTTPTELRELERRAAVIDRQAEQARRVVSRQRQRARVTVLA